MEETVKNLILAVAAVLLPSLCLAQDIQPQTRLVFHTTADLGHGFFATNWVIGNAKHREVDNINLFPGVGFRGDKWWVEAMVQHQWKARGNSSALDFRYGLENGRAEVYLEYALLLSKPGEYEFVFVNMRVWKRLSMGVEREVTSSTGNDSMGAGPRVSIPIGSLKGYEFKLSGAYQVRRNLPDIPRLYIAVNRRFKR